MVLFSHVSVYIFWEKNNSNIFFFSLFQTTTFNRLYHLYQFNEERCLTIYNSISIITLKLTYLCIDQYWVDKWSVIAAIKKKKKCKKYERETAELVAENLTKPWNNYFWWRHCQSYSRLFMSDLKIDELVSSQVIRSTYLYYG